MNNSRTRLKQVLDQMENNLQAKKLELYEKFTNINHQTLYFITLIMMIIFQ